MATNQMWRTTVLVTGVAGSVYYLRGYFGTETGTAQQAADAWYDFVSRTASSTPAGATYSMDAIVDRVSPITGQIDQTIGVTTRSVTGTGGAPLPHANQIMVGWSTGVFINGRELRGHSNMPLPVYAEQNATGQVSDAAVVAWQAKAQTLIDSPAVNFVLWSKKYGQHYPVINRYTKKEFAILRSRRD